MKSMVHLFLFYQLLSISYAQKRNLLVSQSQLESTRAQVFGAYGQDCTPPLDDNPPNNCVETGQSISSPNGKIECSENFDCCLCDTIECGHSRDVNGKIIPCTEFHVNGDSAAFGVQNIDVIGSPITGAVINCGGDHACERTGVFGQNIASVQCAGDYACAQSQWDLTCLPNSPCPVNCRGDNACSSGKISETSMTVSNTAGLSCADDACYHGIFHLQNNIGGGSIECKGEHACQGVRITINNIESIVCGGVNACKNAQIHVIDPQEDFSLDCTAYGSCQGLDLEIYMSKNSNVSFFKGFHCKGASSCLATSINIINYSKKSLTIETLECEAQQSCKYAYFNIINGRFEKCKCGPAIQESCQGTQGIESCFDGLDKLECNGFQSCFNKKQTISNIANDFQLICASKESCRNLKLTIDISANDQIEYIKGYKCSANKSCQNSVITFINQQKYARKPLLIHKIECDGRYSCKNALFKYIGDIEIVDVVCGGYYACNKCKIQINDNKPVFCNQF